ncbi:hypothetical protein GGR53DRAFT_472254 [Hypoxylon sp. FL1150]|nr:hypothetical protein GGR53DRAFT_472254 [Hypoxylon sp. FL1150]
MPRPNKRPRAETDISVAPQPIKRVLHHRADDPNPEGPSSHSRGPIKIPEIPAKDLVEQLPSMATSSKVTLEEVYPEVNLPVDRKNLRFLVKGEKLNSVSYEWKTFGKPDESELYAMKAVAVWEFRKHFIALSTNKFAFQLIKTSLPNVSLSSDVARDIYQHLLEKLDEWKFDFLYNRCYHQASFDGFDQTTSKGRKALETYFAKHTNYTLFKKLYGAAHCQVLDVRLVFAQVYKNKFPKWYFEQVLPFLCAKILLLVRSEWHKNLTTGINGGPCPWIPRIPNARFVQDLELRNNISTLFDNLGTHEKFEDVELNIFPWKFCYDPTEETAVNAKGAAPTDDDLNFINKELTVTSTPPPAGKVEYSKFDDWVEDWSMETSDSEEYEFLTRGNKMPDPTPVLSARIRRCQNLIGLYAAMYGWGKSQD